MKTLNVIGCGKVGQTLARLWTEKNIFLVRSILNASWESGQRAACFVGAGHAVADYQRLDSAEVVMIATPDQAIAACCEQLCRTQTIRAGVIVFHCSGALASAVLSPAKRRGAWIASVHPVKSFLQPQQAVETFPGTFCALEGDGPACQLLGHALECCGAIPFAVEAESKTIYHAATVFACNYLVALLEVGLRCFEQAGVPRETALKLSEPLVRGAVEHVFALGPASALTGPIARGESMVVARQTEALDQWDQLIARVYRVLGLISVDLSTAQGNASAEALERIRTILRGT